MVTVEFSKPRFAFRLRYLRLDRHWSQEYCALAVGVTRQTWIDWEKPNHPRRPCDESIHHLVKFLPALHDLT